MEPADILAGLDGLLSDLPVIDPMVLTLCTVTLYVAAGFGRKAYARTRHRRFTRAVSRYVESTRSTWARDGFSMARITTVMPRRGRGFATVLMEGLDGQDVEFSILNRPSYEQDLVEAMHRATLLGRSARAFRRHGEEAQGRPRAPTREAPAHGCWAVLGIEPDSGEGEVARAWRHLSRSAHPDVPGGSEESMKELNKAKEDALAILQSRS